MMPLADLAQLAIAGKNRVADRRRIVVGESIILAGDDGDGHGALQVSAGRAASVVLPCPQALPRPIARFAERRSGCGPQVRHRTPEGAQRSRRSCPKGPSRTPGRRSLTNRAGRSSSPSRRRCEATSWRPLGEVFLLRTSGLRRLGGWAFGFEQENPSASYLTGIPWQLCLK